MPVHDITEARVLEIAEMHGVTVPQVRGILNDLLGALPSTATPDDELTIGGGRTKVRVGKLIGVAGALWSMFGRRR